MSNFYTFRSSRGTSVTMLRGVGGPTIVGGEGGWEVEDRPRRVGLTIWKKTDPYMMDVPVRFEGFANGRSQENAISILQKMARGNDLNEPPTVEIDGGVPVKAIKWVITSIEWSADEEGLIWKSDGDSEYRLRQDAIVHLTQYNAEDRLVVQGNGNPRAPKMYTVRTGDDLRSISQKMYGTPSRWKDIQAANRKALRDPKRISRMVGKQIKIPA